MLQIEPNKLKIKSQVSESKYVFREEGFGNLLKQAWQRVVTVMCAAKKMIPVYDMTCSLIINDSYKNIGTL